MLKDEYDARWKVGEDRIKKAAATAQNDDASLDERADALAEMAAMLDESMSLLLTAAKGEVVNA